MVMKQVYVAIDTEDIRSSIFICFFIRMCIQFGCQHPFTCIHGLHIAKWRQQLKMKIALLFSLNSRISVGRKN